MQLQAACVKPGKWTAGQESSPEGTCWERANRPTNNAGAPSHNRCHCHSNMLAAAATCSHRCHNKAGQAGPACTLCAGCHLTAKPIYGLAAGTRVYTRPQPHTPGIGWLSRTHSTSAGEQLPLPTLPTSCSHSMSIMDASPVDTISHQGSSSQSAREWHRTCVRPPDWEVAS